jgi:hypothetical protein
MAEAPGAPRSGKFIAGANLRAAPFNRCLEPHIG